MMTYAAAEMDSKAVRQQIAKALKDYSFSAPSLKYSFAIDVLQGEVNIPWLESIEGWDDNTPAPAGPNGEFLNNRWIEYQRKFLGLIPPEPAGRWGATVLGLELLTNSGGYDPQTINIVTHDAFIWIESQRVLIAGVEWPASGEAVKAFFHRFMPDSHYCTADAAWLDR